MAANNYSQYLKEAYENQLKAIDKQTAASKLKTEYDLQQAQATRKNDNRSLYTSYAKAVNPYGINAEKAAQSGLNNSGYAMNVNNNSYKNYQQGLGNNSKAYINTLQELRNDTLANSYNAEAKKLDALSSYNTNLYSEYKRLQELERQLERDKVSDEQWQKQFDLTKLLSGV